MARKKYHQSRRDRRHESEGMERRERMDRGGRTGRKSDELEFGSAHSEPYNLPKEVVYRGFPQSPSELEYGDMGDNIHGIDRELQESHNKIKKQLKPVSY